MPAKTVPPRGSLAGKVVHGASCPLCREELYFFTVNEFGMTYEQCPTTSCANHPPHRPIADPDGGKPRQSEIDRLAKRAAMAMRRKAEHRAAGGRAGIRESRGGRQ